MLLGIAYAGISAWKKTKGLQKLHRELPDEGKLELEKNHPLLKLNGKAVANHILVVCSRWGSIIFVGVSKTGYCLVI